MRVGLRQDYSIAWNGQEFHIANKAFACTLDVCYADKAEFGMLKSEKFSDLHTHLFEMAHSWSSARIAATTDFALVNEPNLNPMRSTSISVK